MDRPPPTPTQSLIVAAIVTATAVWFWVLWLPIARRAVRTGRLLGQGVVYDRHATPIRYWLGFLGALTLALLVTGGAASLIMMLVWDLWK
jgi:hypothetical protein